LGIYGTFVHRYDVLRASGIQELVNTIGNPLKLRAHGIVQWETEGVEATATVNYDCRYRDIISVPHRSVESWTTLDLQLTWELDSGEPAKLAKTEFSLSVHNLLGTDPPFVSNRAGYGWDPIHGDVLGRYLTFGIATRF
jgi:iron complex outermembrane receptor protein